MAIRGSTELSFFDSLKKYKSRLDAVDSSIYYGSKTLLEVFERMKSMPSGEKVQIIIENQPYPVNRSYAAALSPKFSKELNINSSLCELRIKNIKDPNKDFQKFMNNEKIESEFLLKLGIAVENKEIIEIWKKQEEKLKKTNCI